MRVWTVLHYFVFGSWSYYPGDVITQALADARELPEERLTHLTNTGILREAEEAPPPVAPAQDPVDLLHTIQPAPAEEAVPHTESQG